MLGYILMVTVCAGKGREFRSRQLSKEMELQDCSPDAQKVADAHLIAVKAQYHQRVHGLGLFLKYPFAVLYLCS